MKIFKIQGCLMFYYVFNFFIYFIKQRSEIFRGNTVTVDENSGSNCDEQEKNAQGSTPHASAEWYTRTFNLGQSWLAGGLIHHYYKTAYLQKVRVLKTTISLLLHLWQQCLMSTAQLTQHRFPASIWGFQIIVSLCSSFLYFSPSV